MDLTPKPPAYSATDMTQVVLPNDTNPLGFMLGGTAMHLIDIAAALAANRHTRARVVTVAVDAMTFIHPVKVGDVLSVYTEIESIGRTSMKIHVAAWRCSRNGTERAKVTHATFTFVAIGDEGQARVIAKPVSGE